MIDVLIILFPGISLFPKKIDNRRKYLKFLLTLHDEQTSQPIIINYSVN